MNSSRALKITGLVVVLALLPAALHGAAQQLPATSEAPVAGACTGDDAGSGSRQRRSSSTAAGSRALRRTGAPHPGGQVGRGQRTDADHPGSIQQSGGDRDSGHFADRSGGRGQSRRHQQSDPVGRDRPLADARRDRRPRRHRSAHRHRTCLSQPAGSGAGRRRPPGSDRQCSRRQGCRRSEQDGDRLFAPRSSARCRWQRCTSARFCWKSNSPKLTAPSCSNSASTFSAPGQPTRLAPSARSNSQPDRRRYRLKGVIGAPTTGTTSSFQFSDLLEYFPVPAGHQSGSNHQGPAAKIRSGNSGRAQPDGGERSEGKLPRRRRVPLSHRPAEPGIYQQSPFSSSPSAYAWILPAQLATTMSFACTSPPK